MIVYKKNMEQQSCHKNNYNNAYGFALFEGLLSFI